ncbi:MAG TPA: hypothetical protein DEH25_18485 [Chloroflexi bacterium]|nr:hypothetical protein [Chloroflexota bacterium]
MTMTDSQELPAPPRLIPALVAGFDAIANHVLLIVFPFILDLLIWFAPHLRLKNLIETLIAEITTLSISNGAEITNMFEAGKEVWSLMAEQINLSVVLRSYPVGIPSLMAASSPLENPLGSPTMLEIPSIGIAFLIILLLTGVGLVLGTLYYLLVSQIALNGSFQWKQIFSEWPRTSLQVILLALLWVGLFMMVSVPASCLMSVATVAGLPLGQLSVLLYGGLLIWLIFPLLFSPHGIFTNQLKAFASIRSSIRMTNATLSTTVLFVGTVFILSQGLDLLWQIPPANSWLALLGIAGHAFVVTSLLSASFIYYQSAQNWISRLEMKRQSTLNAS